MPNRGVLPLLLLSSLVLAGCERVVNVSGLDYQPRLVVEARLERERTASSADQVIRLSVTQDVFATVSQSAARGATVRVLDDANQATVFVESSQEPGTYRAAAMALPAGRPVTLEIVWGGDTYRSTEVMQPGVAMDSLFFKSEFDEVDTGQNWRATIAVQDPAAQRNFYVWDQWIDGRRLVSPDSEEVTRVVLSDDQFNGAKVRQFQPYSDWLVRPGQHVRVRQLSISEQGYRYFVALSAQTNNTGTPFGVPVSSVRGNVANITNPSKRAVGYFIAGEYSELERRVP
ncbi:MAG: DUF4249 domain-containing protein [Gemmatimonadota bacterium]